MRRPHCFTKPVQNDNGVSVHQVETLFVHGTSCLRSFRFFFEAHAFGTRRLSLLVLASTGLEAVQHSCRRAKDRFFSHGPQHLPNYYFNLGHQLLRGHFCPEVMATWAACFTEERVRLGREQLAMYQASPEPPGIREASQPGKSRINAGRGHLTPLTSLCRMLQCAGDKHVKDTLSAELSSLLDPNKKRGACKENGTTAEL